MKSALAKLFRLTTSLHGNFTKFSSSHPWKQIYSLDQRCFISTRFKIPGEMFVLILFLAKKSQFSVPLDCLIKKAILAYSRDFKMAAFMEMLQHIDNF